MKKLNTSNVIKLVKKPQPEKKGLMVKTSIKSGVGFTMTDTNGNQCRCS